MDYNLIHLKEYAKHLREAAALEAEFIGNLMSEADAFGPAMIGRAKRIESVINRANQTQK